MKEFRKAALLVTVALVMTLMVAALIRADTFPGEFGNGTAESEVEDSNLYDFETIYHFDNSSRSRNGYFPEYEYQMAGEYVHFDAWITNVNAPAVEDTNVTVVITCPSECNSRVLVTRVQLVWDGATSEFYEGYYVAHYHNDFVIPADMYGDCVLTVEMTPDGGSMTTDDLSESIYMNVNDLLANPTIQVSASGPLSFPNLVRNALNPATPYPIIYTLSGDSTCGHDREGQGVIGNFSVGVSDLVGATVPHSDIILANNIRYHTGSNPANIWLARTNLKFGWTFDPIVYGVHVMYGWADLSNSANTNLAGNFNELVYYELYYASSHTDTSYGFSHAWVYAVV